MDVMKIVDSMQPGIQMTRQNISRIAMEADKSFRETLLHNLVERLVKYDQIEHIGRNCYIKCNGDAKKEYRVTYSKEAADIIQDLKAGCPELSFSVFELQWLNEFLSEPLWANYIFIDVEKSRALFLFTYEQLLWDSVLMTPDEKEISRYAYNGTVIINCLISESPKVESEGLVSLEKIMVDLLASKVMKSILSPVKVPDIIRAMFDKYKVNQSTLLRYARRRYKEQQMRKVLGNRITVKV
ncbi:MAG: hypothetical protein LUD51_04025 [Clostridia bacterium]|nr:hypothetical protein [Clostridia bacterium]